MKNLIDFDKKFAEYTEEWMRGNAKNFATLAQMEAHMPELYLKWLNAPAQWLGGRTPGDYFTQWTSPAELIEMLLGYLKRRVSPPDPLLEAIAGLGEAASPGLVALLSPGQPAEAQMLAVSLLTEIDEGQPVELYVEAISQESHPPEVRERMAEALSGMGYAVVEPCLAALAEAQDDAAELLLGVLSDYPGHDEVTTRLIEMFRRVPSRWPLLASFMAKYGDDRALPVLEQAVLDTDSYIAYLEIRNAIEALGGNPAPERSFEGDPDYESMRQII